MRSMKCVLWEKGSHSRSWCDCNCDDGADDMLIRIMTTKGRGGGGGRGGR